MCRLHMNINAGWGWIRYGVWGGKVRTTGGPVSGDTITSYASLPRSCIGLHSSASFRAMGIPGDYASTMQYL